MDWKELQAEILERNENRITITAAKACLILGCGRDAFLRLARDLDRVPHSKSFFVHDIAVKWCGGEPKRRNKGESR